MAQIADIPLELNVLAVGIGDVGCRSDHFDFCAGEHANVVRVTQQIIHGIVAGKGAAAMQAQIKVIFAILLHQITSLNGGITQAKKAASTAFKHFLVTRDKQFTQGAVSSRVMDKIDVLVHFLVEVSIFVLGSHIVLGCVFGRRLQVVEDTVECNKVLLHGLSRLRVNKGCLAKVCPLAVLDFAQFVNIKTVRFYFVEVHFWVFSQTSAFCLNFAATFWIFYGVAIGIGFKGHHAMFGYGLAAIDGIHPGNGEIVKEHVFAAMNVFVQFVFQCLYVHRHHRLVRCLVIIQVKLADGCEVLSAFGAAYFKDAIADDRTAVAAFVAFFPAKSQQVAAQYFAGCIAVTAMGVAIIDAKFDEAVVFGLDWPVCILRCGLCHPHRCDIFR